MNVDEKWNTWGTIFATSIAHNDEIEAGSSEFKTTFIIDLDASAIYFTISAIQAYAIGLEFDLW